MTLLTGATGYIGGRLLRKFEEDGRLVRCLARRPATLGATQSTTEVVQGDCLDEASLDRALAGVESAYYLVHSMAGSASFVEADRRAADNFGRAAARAGVRRIIYLGGLASDADTLSTHLKSRAETGDILRASGIPVIEFRASVVIGAGSLSFKMIQALVERLPVMVCPRWVDTRTQPIAIRDVVAYLAGALDLPHEGSRIFEIGGADVVSYGGMMREYAKLRGLRRLLLPVPVLTPHLSGLWLALVTPSQARVGRALVEGLKNSTIVRSHDARQTFSIEPTSLGAALREAIAEGLPARLRIDTRATVVAVPPAGAFAPIRRIGGASGWYFLNLLWRIRGWMDGWMGGVGMRRGRLDPDLCGTGDVIDGWTVEAFEPDRRLRLSSDWILPGRGWLEFEVTALDDGRRSRIRQTAAFDPRGLLGRAYWYALVPIHSLLFRGLLDRIALRAVRDHERPDLGQASPNIEQTVTTRQYPHVVESAAMTTPPPRIIAIDALRGLVMLLMLAEAMRLWTLHAAFPDSRFWALVAYNTEHVPWQGCSLHDLIQPAFSFLVGAALPFSIASRQAKGQTFGRMVFHAAWRSVALIALGIFLRSLHGSRTYWTFEDTLTQIGLGYTFLFLLAFASIRTQAIAFVAILVGYWAAFVLYPLPPPDFEYPSVGVPADWPHLYSGFLAHFNMNSNVSWAFDTWFLNLFPRLEPFRFNRGGWSTLSFIPTLATMILGLWCGAWLKSARSGADKLKGLVLSGIVLTVTGLALQWLHVVPIVKRIWTSSYTLYSGGLVILMLAAFYFAIEMKGWRRWAFPLLVTGANSIAVYVMSWTLEDFVKGALGRHIGHAPFMLLGAPFEPVLKGAAVLLTFWLVLWWMYRRRIFLKI